MPHPRRAEEEITLAYLMTPLAEGVLEEGLPPGLPLPTRALIIGGDRLHHRPVPGVSFRLMNHYGPAEYTVTSTVVPVPTPLKVRPFTSLSGVTLVPPYSMRTYWRMPEESSLRGPLRTFPQP